MSDGGVGPGMGAFTVFFLLALVLWLLMRNMNSRLRRMDYAHREEDARLAAEEAAKGRPSAAPDLGVKRAERVQDDTDDNASDAAT